jgi:hypothetical protein
VVLVLYLKLHYTLKVFLLQVLFSPSAGRIWLFHRENSVLCESTALLRASHCERSTGWVAPVPSGLFPALSTWERLKRWRRAACREAGKRNMSHCRTRKLDYKLGVVAHTVTLAEVEAGEL